MTYSDPNRNRNSRSDNTMTWIIGALAAIVLVGAIAYGISVSGDQTASTTATPTTGQGADTSTSAPANPAPANR